MIVTSTETTMSPKSPATTLSRRLVAADVLRREASAIAGLIDRVDENFDRAIEMLLKVRGRVIVTGIGKSGLIGQKIAATLSSTGTPASFLHPVEAGHGDLGVVNQADLVLAISKSAETEEIGDLLPAFKALGVPIILIAGSPRGELAKRADVVLDASVSAEADPHDLVPTSSTTAALAMGDALAVCLMAERGLTPEDFARFHPLGALGRRLLLTVSDLMHTGDDIPLAGRTASFKELLVEMTRKRLGCSGVVDDAGKLVGIFTDGDLRRQIERHSNLFSLTAADMMTANPKTVSATELAVSALTIMEDAKITVLFVVDDAHKPLGVLHMHDVLSSGAA
jgi:arabinose-5-phosphate isomerase